MTCLLMASPANAEPAARKIYLLIGQSNMAGRGVVEESDRQTDPRIWMFTESGEWKPAEEPIRYDKPAHAGVGPGLAFGRAMAKALPGAEIGLVNRAFGGTSIAQWKKGGQLYNDAVSAAKAAAAQGTIKGILWHQGESDYKKLVKEFYKAALVELIANLRKELGAPELPVVLGELGPYLQPADPSPQVVNDVLHEISKEIPKVGVASSEGLKDKGDKLHFDTASQRIFGQRYAEEMLRLQALP
ncbi:MAG: sialate O-acetylesterase [Verrucomicrobiota bacterium]